jgi:hypothetical protein
MTISDEISIIANKLANQGKTPSVALIKSHLNQTVPLPKIIATLKNWQHDPTFIKAQHHEAPTKEVVELMPNEEAINLLIAKAVMPLQHEISALKKQVKQLLDSQ